MSTILYEIYISNKYFSSTYSYSDMISIKLFLHKMNPKVLIYHKEIKLL